MHDGDAEQRPALLGGFGVARDLRLGHAGIMLERHGHERRARLMPAANAGEGDDGTDIGAAAREFRRLDRGVEWFALQTDGGGHLCGSAIASGRT